MQVGGMAGCCTCVGIVVVGMAGGLTCICLSFPLGAPLAPWLLGDWLG